MRPADPAAPRADGSLPPRAGETAAIVRVADEHPADEADVLQRARAFAEPLLAGEVLDTGEPAFAHAEGVAQLLAAIGAGPATCAAAYLVYAGDRLQRPEEVVEKAFGASYARLVSHTRRLVQIQRAARAARLEAGQRARQVERVRKMLLAFSQDLRVVLLRLASRLQTLRFHAASRSPCPPELAAETLQVFVPLASRLGIWQIKWEMEDLAFRFSDPQAYHAVARLLDERRVERERQVEDFREALAALLAAHGLRAEVYGRPKHLYSIWRKMRGKALDIDRVFDLRAVRVLVDDVEACYAALGRVHARWQPVEGEFDDYVARPKPNGYQSLHTVVVADDGRPVEVQIRTHAMHAHAEHGVAAHWAYKEAGTRGYGGASQAAADDARLAEARKAVLRQLLDWERELSAGEGGAEAAAGGAPAALAAAGSASGEPAAPGSADAAADPRLYVFTPQAAVVDLPAGATPLDFAYAVHTTLGHGCRGARVDGAMVPLNTPLRSGQTVEIVGGREGGPSLDWLNPDHGYLQSPRARAKVRAWFNARQLERTVARGREAVERLLQREGRTALRLDDLARQLGFRSAEALFEVVGKDEYSLRHIEALLRPAEPPAEAAAPIALRRPRHEEAADGRGVLVVGVESLLTSLSRCCRPAPPDEIGGYVTRGRGVAIHRRDCSNFREMAQRTPERVIPVAWGRQASADAVYPVDVLVEAQDRQGLLRDLSELFAKEKMNVIAVNSRSARAAAGATAWLTFTVEVGDAARLAQALAQLRQVPGVRQARRR
ncbi:RelA/SpoT family protein [Piscinibacter sakaiensis]|uniref:GTP pyrophosphokinase n=1 Tax=Piscinibacter sakaiensis TaxID=1547922 RepID=A0A0K8P3Q4_PISS1|nr:HD domain-containing protein [Piscinibacter sakaiensis]GAP37189.1 GTP pyrophosphokinase [Piscinibacter sakaiensis]